MLGNDLVLLLKRRHINFQAYDIEDIDITNNPDISKLSKANPDIIINCAAFTDVDLAEGERKRCYDINFHGVRNLVNYCIINKATLVQISTDYVFSGDKLSYDESDVKNPINYYGKSKSDAEEIIMRKLTSYYIIRTSSLFGRYGDNFVKKIISASERHNIIKVVRDQVSSPTYTKDISSAILRLILANKPYGIYHMTNSGSCSRYKLALAIKKMMGLKSKIIPTDIISSKTATRPKYSVLRNTKTKNLRHWKYALRDYLEGYCC